MMKNKKDAGKIVVAENDEFDDSSEDEEKVADSSTISGKKNSKTMKGIKEKKSS